MLSRDLIKMKSRHRSRIFFILFYMTGEKTRIINIGIGPIKKIKPKYKKNVDYPRIIA